jgi:hypothetical protein
MARPPSILNRHIRCVRSLRLSDVFHWCELAVNPRLLPEPQCDWKRIDVELLPPGGFVTGAMKLAMMDPADRDDELVAHAAAEGAGLREGEVMRIRRHAPAHQARLPNYKLPVVFVAEANRFA